MDDQIDPGDNFFGINLADCMMVPIMDSVVGLKAANAHLTRQLAEQALAHAEQMEGMRASMPKKSGSQLYAEMMGQAVDQCELTNLHRELAAARAFIERLKAAELSAMRVTPATQPTDAQQTASDVKAAQEPKAFPAGALKAGGSDPRRIGG